MPYRWIEVRRAEKVYDLYIVWLENTFDGEDWRLVIRDPYDTPHDILRRVVDGLITKWHGNESWVTEGSEGYYRWVKFKLGDMEYTYPYAVLREE